MTQELAKRSIPFHTLPFKKWMSKSRWKAPARLAMNLAVLPLLVRKVRQWNVDLIHTNSSVTPIGALTAEALGLPHTWHVREFGNLDFNLRYDWGEFPFRLLMSRSTVAIAVSRAVRNHVLSGIDVPSHVVYNGVISKSRLVQINEKCQKRGENLSETYTFAIIGQISPSKGQKQALRALYRLKQEGTKSRLLVAGSGSEDHMESLRELHRALELQKDVSLLGYVSDPFEVYREADAVLMCSPHEAMGRVTAEAMATGKPVIGYNSDGTAELVDHKHNGLLYDGTDEDLAHCMQCFVDDPLWARSLGQNGHEEAHRKYTNEVYARQVYDILSGF